jgi:hypothetical protein
MAELGFGVAFNESSLLKLRNEALNHIAAVMPAAAHRASNQ